MIELFNNAREIPKSHRGISSGESGRECASAMHAKFPVWLVAATRLYRWELAPASSERDFIQSAMLSMSSQVKARCFDGDGAKANTACERVVLVRILREILVEPFCIINFILL